MKLVFVESHGGHFYHELHKQDCKDLKKKADYVFGHVVFEGVADAKEYYEAKNAQYEDGGYDFDEHCKVYPCAKEGE